MKENKSVITVEDIFIYDDNKRPVSRKRKVIIDGVIIREEHIPVTFDNSDTDVLNNFLRYCYIEKENKKVGFYSNR